LRSTGALGPDDLLVDVLVERLEAAGALRGGPVVLAPAGSSDARAQADSADMAARLEQRWGGTVHLGYAAGPVPSVADAVTVARAVSRSNLLKCAIHGEDPNWGRVLAAVGTTDAAFEPDRLAVALNDVWVCREGTAAEDRGKADLSGREVSVVVDLAAGRAEVTVWTNDLTAAYVHENSAYST